MCWKYLKPGEPRDNTHCHMYMNSITRSLTKLDPDTYSILLHCLHSWINNYNNVVLFLLGSNMDIKFIGSGEAVKALTYYVIDYITKSALPMHLALSALCYAIKMNNHKFPADQAMPPTVVHKSLIMKVVNTMMAQQEMLHQQVISYLIGGGNFYTSYSFWSLAWGEFDRYFTHMESGMPIPEDTSPSLKTHQLFGNPPASASPVFMDVIDNATPEGILIPGAPSSVLLSPIIPDLDDGEPDSLVNDITGNNVTITVGSGKC